MRSAIKRLEHHATDPNDGFSASRYLSPRARLSFENRSSTGPTGDSCFSASHLTPRRARGAIQHAAEGPVLALFDASATIANAIVATVVGTVVGVAAAVHHAATPTRRLPHPAKVCREQRHAAMLNRVLFAVLLLLVCSATFDLNSWAEWTVFGVIVMTAVGAGIAVQTRLR